MSATSSKWNAFAYVNITLKNFDKKQPNMNNYNTNIFYSFIIITDRRHRPWQPDRKMSPFWEYVPQNALLPSDATTSFSFGR